MQKVRVAVIGCGFSGRLHAHGYKKLPGVEICACADAQEERVKQFGQEFNIARTYTDYKEILAKEDLDLLSICVPNFLHRDVFMAAAEAGKKNIVCEKALASTVGDAKEMVRIAKEKKIHLMYAENWLFSPPLQRAKEICAQGAIGEILWIKAKESHSGSHSPHAQTIKACGGGAMANLGIHPIGFVRWFTGKEVKQVLGKASPGGEKNFVHKKLEGEDWAVGLLSFDDETYALVEGNYITCGGLDNIVEIYGKEGVIKIDLSQGSPLSVYSRKGYDYAIEKTDFTQGWTRPAFEEEWSGGYFDEIAHFVDCARNNKEAMPGARGEDGLIALKIVQAIYQSNKEEKVIKF